MLPPLILTSLAIYLSSLSYLWRRAEDTSTGEKRQEQLQIRKRTKERITSPLKTLLTGLPSKNNVISSVVTIFINVLVAAFTLDFLFRALLLYPVDDLTFSRVGYVSPTTAKVLVREPDVAHFPLTISYQEASKSENSKWVEEGKIYKLDNTTDFTYPVTLKELKPSTQYRYLLSNNQTGSFITAPLPGSQSANRLTFLTSSCIKPNFPYNPFSHPLRVVGVEIVSRAIAKLPSLGRPSFMLFLGDFIYIDVPLRFGSSQDHYRSEYRRVYSSPSWYEPQEDPPIDLPWIHTLDDHEIANDWAFGNTTHPFPEAVEPYSHYHVSVNPPIPPTPFAAPENTTYFSFIHGPASIFMLDTRAYRTIPNFSNSTILGSAQLSSLLDYLARPEPAEVRWKIVASSVPFTKNWHVGTEDTWGGFLHERRTVLEAMWRAERELGIRIVLLSGDRHEFGATRFPDPDRHLASNELAPGTEGEGVHEFSVGPLNMFYLPIRSYRQTDDEDVMVKYAPDGNVKFGQIDIDVYEGDGESDIAADASNSGPHSVLTYSLYVDGTVVWKYQLSVPIYPDELGVSSEHLPPGRVLVDKVAGWNPKETFSLLYDTARFTLDDLRDGAAPFLDWTRRAMRLD